MSFLNSLNMTSFTVMLRLLYQDRFANFMIEDVSKVLHALDSSDDMSSFIDDWRRNNSRDVFGLYTFFLTLLDRDTICLAATEISLFKLHVCDDLMLY